MNDLKKTDVKKELDLYWEVKDGKIHILGVAEVKNLYLRKGTFLVIEDLKEGIKGSTNRAWEHST